MDEVLSDARRDVERSPGDACARLGLAQALLRAGAPPAEARAALRGALDLREAAALDRKLFLETTRDLDDATLRTAIGRALGLPGPFVDPIDWARFDLLAGAVEPETETVAWVEDRSRPETAWDLCEVDLHVARGGAQRVLWPLQHYNPYFGTTVHHLHVDAAHAVVVYTEKHSTLAAVVPLNGPPIVAAVQPGCLVLPDRILSADEAGLHCLRLPNIARIESRRIPGVEHRYLRVELTDDGDAVVVLDDRAKDRVELARVPIERWHLAR